MEKGEGRRELGGETPLVRSARLFEDFFPPFGPPRRGPAGQGLDHEDRSAAPCRREKRVEELPPPRRLELVHYVRGDDRVPFSGRRRLVKRLVMDPAAGPERREEPPRPVRG